MIYSKLHNYVRTLLEVLVLHVPLTFVKIIVIIYNNTFSHIVSFKTFYSNSRNESTIDVAT